jgi:hypothetical protein
LADFIRPHPWTYYVTLTYPRAVHEEQGRKRFLRLIEVLNQHRDRKSHHPVVWVRADERQRRGVLHHHCLVGFVEGVRPLQIAQFWQRIGGGHADVRVYDRTRRAALYLAKQLDLELSEPWWPAQS